jgi:hypothetical protein
MMSKIERILNSNGKIFTVTFLKKDGSIRVLNGRLGVTKHLKGGQCTLDKDKFIIVYDLKSEGYRAIDKESILDVVGV